MPPLLTSITLPFLWLWDLYAHLHSLFGLWELGLICFGGTLRKWLRYFAFWFVAGNHSIWLCFFFFLGGSTKVSSTVEAATAFNSVTYACNWFCYKSARQFFNMYLLEVQILLAVLQCLVIYGIKLSLITKCDLKVLHGIFTGFPFQLFSWKKVDTRWWYCPGFGADLLEMTSSLERSLDLLGTMSRYWGGSAGENHKVSDRSAGDDYQVSGRLAGDNV